MNRLLRPVIVAALGTAASGSVAHANVEIGGTAGLHVFSTTNELGVPDVKDAPSLRNSALFGLRIGVMFNDMLGIEGEFGVIPSEARVGVFDVWTLAYRAHLIAQFGAADPAKKLIPFALVGAGGTSVVDSKNQDLIAKDTDAAMYIGVGAKYRVDNGWGLRGDLRVLFPPSSASSGPTVDFEALLSIYKEFGRKTAKAVEQPSGPKDSDGDGIPDDQDKCPNEPEDKDGFQDDDGCPDRDNDGDGIPDADDKCPNEPEDKDGFEDDDGCPDQDNDGDGFPDAVDKCPNDPETVNGFEDDDGCPDVRATTGPEERPDRIDLKGQPVAFDKTGKLTPAAKTLLTQVAQIIRTRKLTIRVEVHVPLGTKVTGAAAVAAQKKKDKATAQKRAQAIFDFLISQGVPQAQVQAVGIGADRPLGSANPTDAINERVDLIKAQQGAP